MANVDFVTFGNTNPRDNGAFGILVDGGTRFGRTTLPMIKGSWQQSRTQNGNYQVTCRVRVGDAEVEALERAHRFFADVEQYATLKLPHDYFNVGQSVKGFDFGRARVIRGSITSADHPAYSRFRNSVYSEWIVEFERYKFLESVKEISTDFTAAEQYYSWSVHGLNAYGHSENLGPFYSRSGQGRAWLTTIWTEDGTGSSDSLRIKKLWLGIQENRYRDGVPCSFSPYIEITSDNVTETDSLSAVVDNGGLDFGGIVQQRVECNWLVGSGTRNTWARRFIMPMGRGWNGDVAGYNAEDKRINRDDHRGRYHLLMRYRTNQRDGDIPAPGTIPRTDVVQTGVRGISLWRGEGLPQLWQGGEHWLRHDNKTHHWIDLGVIDLLPGNDATLAPNMGRFSIGLDTMVVNIPAGATSDGNRRLSDSQDYAFIVEKFHLIPADRFLYLEMPGSGMPRFGQAKVHIDHDGIAYASGVDKGQGGNEVTWELPGLETSGWGPPSTEKSYITGVVEPSTATTIGAKVYVRIFGRERTQGDLLIK